jgi:hypothetical protein
MVAIRLPLSPLKPDVIDWILHRSSARTNVKWVKQSRYEVFTAVTMKNGAFWDVVWLL